MSVETQSAPSALSASPTTVDGYLAAVDETSDEDRQFASTVAVNLVEIIKAFNSVKNRMHGVNHPDAVDFGLVIKLVKEGPMRASDLSEQLCADPSTVSRQVAGLVKAGLLERRADPHDGRASILAPTEAGLSRVQQFVQMRGKIFAPLMAQWSPEDRATFARLLADFAGGLTTNLEAVKNVATELIQPGAQRRTA